MWIWPCPDVGPSSCGLGVVLANSWRGLVVLAKLSRARLAWACGGWCFWRHGIGLLRGLNVLGLVMVL